MTIAKNPSNIAIQAFDTTVFLRLLERIKINNQIYIEKSQSDKIKAWADDFGALTLAIKTDDEDIFFIVIGSYTIKIHKVLDDITCYHNINNVEHFLYDVEHHIEMTAQNFAMLKDLLALLDIKCNFDLVMTAKENFGDDWALYDISMYDKYTLIKSTARSISVGIWQQKDPLTKSWIGFARTLTIRAGSFAIFVPDDVIQRDFAEFTVETSDFI